VIANTAARFSMRKGMPVDASLGNTSLGNVGLGRTAKPFYRPLPKWHILRTMDASRLQDTIDWLTDVARSAPLPTELLAQSCERLVGAGLPLWRVAAFVRTLHPDMYGRSFVWRPGADVVVNSADFDIEESAEFKQSPLSIVYRSGKELRYRMEEPESRRFSFFDDMRNEGVTDYIILPLLFTDGSIHPSSWATKHPDGFTDEQLAGLRRVGRPFARLAEIFALRRTATTLLDTYVGNRAGERILAGDIRRGHAETMQAAIWLSDLRGFTSLSDRLPPEVVVDILNQYFDCQVPAIRKHGGEILKFMGDGLLAVFPIAKDGGNLGEVCSRVLEAAGEARANVDAMHYPNPRGEAVEHFRFGVALHIGGILFGNIGGMSRLDFTCIGPAVNLAARLEKIAAQLKRTVVASAAFAGVITNRWTDLGEFPVAGFSKPQRVFGLRDEVA
jgi:adenylate cyclase